MAAPSVWLQQHRQPKMAGLAAAGSEWKPHHLVLRRGALMSLRAECCQSSIPHLQQQFWL